MARQDPLAVWSEELSAALPYLSKPQLKGLAEWSFGMILARCCCLDTVTSYLADWLGQPELSVRSRLREWYLPAELKSGSKHGGKRQDLEVTTCFAPLLRWLVRDWPQPRLALALDASTLSERFVLLAVSVLYRSCAFPVAWKVLPATAKGSWKPHWLDLLESLRDAVPRNWLVVMLADRGLWASWLFEKIQSLYWHPLMRVNKSGHFRPDNRNVFVPLEQLVPQMGMNWSGRGMAFATPQRRVNGTLLGWWGQGHKEPWLILSDLAPIKGMHRGTACAAGSSKDSRTAKEVAGSGSAAGWKIRKGQSGCGWQWQ